VFVTHDQAEAMALGRSIVVMEGGRVAQCGSPEEVYRRPATRFVGTFLGILNALGADRFCRPEALRVDPGGELEVMVRACFFEGGRYRVVALAEGGASEITFDCRASPPTPGSMLRLAVDPAAILTLPR
jgi:ABC-type sugar transport system ATPase subunit